MPRRDIGVRFSAEIERLKEASRQSEVLNQEGDCADALAICETSRAVQKACEFIGLDHKNPRHLANLLVSFAAAHFPDSKSGRPKQWDSIRLCSLLRQFLRRHRDNPTATYEKICEEFCKEIARGGYPWLKCTPKTMPRLLSDAMDYKKNTLLRDFLSNWEETGGAPVKRRRGPPLDWRKIPPEKK